MKIYKITAGVLLLTIILMAITIAPAIAKASLYVKVKTDKDFYAVGEPMNFIIKVYNDGDTAVNNVRVYSAIYGPLNVSGNFKYNLGTIALRDDKEITIPAASTGPGHFRNKVIVRGMDDEFFGEDIIDGSIKTGPVNVDIPTGVTISYIGLLGIIGLLSRRWRI